MFNANKFKALVIVGGLSFNDVADKLKIAPTTLYRKIKRDGDFSRSEIQTLRTMFGKEEIEDIFFENKLT